MEKPLGDSSTIDWTIDYLETRFGALWLPLAIIPENRCQSYRFGYHGNAPTLVSTRTLDIYPHLMKE